MASSMKAKLDAQNVVTPASGHVDVEKSSEKMDRGG